MRMQTLRAAVALTDQQSQPVNDEAKRVLKFFMATLLNSNMPRPADFDSMKSLTTLVPHYAEDVIYALDADEVEARTGKKVRTRAPWSFDGTMPDVPGRQGYVLLAVLPVPAHTWSHVSSLAHTTFVCAWRLCTEIERLRPQVTPGKMTELVGIMEGMQISTLEFLRIQFADEWANFIERLLVRHGITGATRLRIDAHAG
jgi:hypothetical protein